MKKLDGYILKKLLTTFVFVVVLLVTIICVIDYTDKSDNFIRAEVTAEQIRQYYISFAPYFAALLTPITAFIGTVLVTTKLAARTEIIAILASGVSFRRLSLPYLMAAIIIGSVSYYLNGYVIPDANKFRVHFELEYLKNPFQNTDQNIHLKVSPHDYVYMSRYNNGRDAGYNVTLEHFEEDLLKEKLRANRIQWDSTKRSWTLYNWQLRVLEEDGEVVSEGVEMDTVLNMLPSDFGNKHMLETTLTMPELKAYINLQLSRGADDVKIYRVERYIRVMQPFTVVVLAFIGLLVSARKSRRGTGFQIALGFFIAFIFIILFVFAQAIAAAGTMPPLLAIWLPNIIFTGVGVVIYKTVPR
jgi:lipopolysaccharide export system permease protein